jgi:hypothetical protein
MRPESIDSFSLERLKLMSADDLIDLFYDTEASPEVSEELSIRLFEHAEFDGDPKSTPLNDQNGVQVVEGNTPLMLSDYIKYASNHHFYALDGIFEFFNTAPGQPEYEATRASIINRLSSS